MGLSAPSRNWFYQAGGVRPNERTRPRYFLYGVVCVEISRKHGDDFMIIVSLATTNGFASGLVRNGPAPKQTRPSRSKTDLPRRVVGIKPTALPGRSKDQRRDWTSAFGPPVQHVALDLTSARPKK
jgi:hypothetical protein